MMAEAYGVPVILHTDHAAKYYLGLTVYWMLVRKCLLNRGVRFGSHMIDLSEEPIEENIDIVAYLERMSKMGMTLEMRWVLQVAKKMV